VFFPCLSFVHNKTKNPPQKYKNKCIVAVEKKKMSEYGSESVSEFVVNIGAER
jgi:hypothetical protein